MVDSMFFQNLFLVPVRIVKTNIAQLYQHVQNVQTSANDDTATGQHFNIPGHTLSDMTVTVLEKVKTSDMMYRKECDKYLIRKFILTIGG